MSKVESIKEGDVNWKIGRYDNGNIHWQIPYVNGKVNGLQTRFYNNGNIHWQKPWVNDKQHGLATWFYKDGSLNDLIKWKNDELKLHIIFPKNKMRKPQTIKVNLIKKESICHNIKKEQ